MPFVLVILDGACFSLLDLGLDLGLDLDVDLDVDLAAEVVRVRACSSVCVLFILIFEWRRRL